MNCLGCGRELPKVDELAKRMGKTGDLDLLVCGCDAVMVFDVKNKKLRPPHVSECRFFVEKMLPKVIAQVQQLVDGDEERHGKCPDCGAEFNRMTAPQDPSLKPEPGNYTLCSFCGAVAVFDEKLELRRPTKEEQETREFAQCLRASAQLQVMLADREARKP